MTSIPRLLGFIFLRAVLWAALIGGALKLCKVLEHTDFPDRDDTCAEDQDAYADAGRLDP